MAKHFTDQLGKSIIVNPGTEPLADSSAATAAANMPQLLADTGLGFLTFTRSEAADYAAEYGDGRYAFIVTDAAGDVEVEVQMPGVALTDVRFLGRASGQNIWDFPRLYIEGSSWVWYYAVNQLRHALTEEDDWHWEPDVTPLRLNFRTRLSTSTRELHMSQSRYNFSSTRNGYFNGLDLRVEDKETHEVVTLNEKEGMLAIEVKDDDVRSRWAASVQTAADLIGEEALNGLYTSAQAAYWEASKIAAAEAGLGEVFAAGRSGGWMVVDGSKPYSLEDIIDPPDDELEEAAEFADRFLRFAFERVADIEWHRIGFFNALKDAAMDKRSRRVYDSKGGSAVDNRRAVGDPEPIRVLVVTWADEDGPNVDCYRNAPALVEALGDEYAPQVSEALENPGAAIRLNDQSVLRYCTVREV